MIFFRHPPLRLRLHRLAGRFVRAGRTFRNWMVVAVCACCVACATLPDRVVETYGITQAHAVAGTSVSRLSYVGFNSFVFGHAGRAPLFPRQPAAALEEDGITVRIFPSSRLSASGFGSDAAVTLAKRLVGVHHPALPRYVGKPVPVERLDVHLLHPSEQLTDRGRSFSLSQRHRLRFAFSFDPAHEGNAIRGVVRTAAHELLHVSLAVYGRRDSPGPREEQAAYAIEHCVELDLFGETSAPTRKTVVPDPKDDSVMTSLAAGHAADPELQAAFDGQEVLFPERSGTLRELCRNRVRSLAGYPID